MSDSPSAVATTRLGLADPPAGAPDSTPAALVGGPIPPDGRTLRGDLSTDPR